MRAFSTNFVYMANSFETLSFQDTLRVHTSNIAFVLPSKSQTLPTKGAVSGNLKNDLF